MSNVQRFSCARLHQPVNRQRHSISRRDTKGLENSEKVSLSL